MRNVEKMIVSVYRDAIPKKDFTLELDGNDHPFIVVWNVAKLGERPALEEVRAVYLRRLARLKARGISTDEADPMPWLAKEPNIPSSPPVNGNTTTNIYNMSAETGENHRTEYHNGYAITRVK